MEGLGEDYVLCLHSGYVWLLSSSSPLNSLHLALNVHFHHVREVSCMSVSG